METPINFPSPPAKVINKPVTSKGNAKSKFPAFLQRKGLWLIGGVLIIVAVVLVYYWTFGKAKINYTTAAVVRGDVESTVVAAGVLQPVKYVDVGAQTSGMLKSLKVQRGDQVVEESVAGGDRSCSGEHGAYFGQCDASKYDFATICKTGAARACKSPTNSQRHTFYAGDNFRQRPRHHSRRV